MTYYIIALVVHIILMIGVARLAYRVGVKDGINLVNKTMQMVANRGKNND